MTLVNRLDDGAMGEVLRFDVARRAKDDSRVPSRLASIERLDPADVVVTRDFKLSLGARGQGHGSHGSSGGSTGSGSSGGGRDGSGGGNRHGRLTPDGDAVLYEAVVSGDATLIRVILRNLVVNAIRYTERGAILHTSGG